MYGRLFNLKKIKKESLIFILEVLLMLAICFLHSLSAGHYVDFWPINGTFQKFNPVRRFLSGQIPYRDFQDYLGLGHLYAGTIMTLIFGGDYQGSLVAFTFLSFVGLASLSLMVGMAVFKRKEIAVTLTNIILLMLLIKPLPFVNGIAGTGDILEALQYALGAGNSARYIRGMILPISCFLIVKVIDIISARKRLAKGKKEVFSYIGVGLVAGFAFGWSNDYGISCWVCLGVMAFWISICRTRKFLISLKMTLIEIVSSLAGIFISVEIFTAGHFTEWMRSTFGTGGYQAWYFNSSKSYYLYNVEFTYIMLIQAGFAVLYLWKLFTAKGSRDAIKRYGILAFANMTGFCAVNEYKILSGGGSREVALAVLFLTILFQILYSFRHFLDKLQFEKIIYTGTVLAGMAWCVSSTKDEMIFSLFEEKGGVYVEALGGNLTERGQDLLDTDTFLNGEDFFATYASAQEVVSDTFQPSGTDYIIHVLGDKQRRDYLESFQNGDFRYAATMKESLTNWEFWVERANWFFYRELYENWHPVYANSYELYWERNNKPGENTLTDGFEIMVIDVDDTTKKIVVLCDQQVNGMADVYIDYAVKKNNRRSSKLLIQTELQVVNTGTMYAGDIYYESNYLRNTSAEYIPVPVINGYGEIEIKSCPTKNTYLQLNSISCDRIYTVASDFLEVTSIAETEDNTSIIVIPYTQKNMDATNGAVAVLYNGIEAEIQEITQEDSVIYITVSGKLQKTQNNILKLIKEKG